MASFNKVILMGNLTRDPELRMTGTNGMKVARLRLAVNERRRDRNGQVQDFPVYIDVDAWDKLAELCGQYLAKGRPILGERRLQMDSWEKDGVKHQKLKVRAATIKFRSQGGGPTGGTVREEQEQPAAPMAEDDPGDIPF